MIYVKDPLSFKASISISLEVLPGGDYSLLREFVGSIPSTVRELCLDSSKELEQNLENCIVKFKETKTYFWLREDFKNALYDVERQISKRIS